MNGESFGGEFLVSDAPASSGGAASSVAVCRILCLCGTGIPVPRDPEIGRAHV